MCISKDNGVLDYYRSMLYQVHVLSMVVTTAPDRPYFTRNTLKNELPSVVSSVLLALRKALFRLCSQHIVELQLKRCRVDTSSDASQLHQWRELARASWRTSHSNAPRLLGWHSRSSDSPYDRYHARYHQKWENNKNFDEDWNSQTAIVRPWGWCDCWWNEVVSLLAVAGGPNHGNFKIEKR